MDKKYFFIRLNSLRPDFIQTMTDVERATMQLHAVYWREFMEKGRVIVYGPVFDPQGPFGMGVVSVESEEELKEFVAGDPACQLSSIDYYPMQAVLPASFQNSSQ